MFRFFVPIQIARMCETTKLKINPTDRLSAIYFLIRILISCERSWVDGTDLENIRAGATRGAWRGSRRVVHAPRAPDRLGLRFRSFCLNLTQRHPRPRTVIRGQLILKFEK